MEPAAAAPDAGRPPPGPAMHWIGPPTGMDPTATHYRAAQVNALPITIGDFVYLQPAEPNIPLYIARVEDLIHLHPQAPPTDTAGAAPAAPPEPQMFVAVSWYYRPQELVDLDHPIQVYDNEVFASDDTAQLDLASVAGRCNVVPPGSPTLRLRAAGGELDTYVCSRKYVPEEGRIVPLEGVQEPEGDEARPFVLTHGQIFSRLAPPAAAAAAAATAGQEAPPKRRKKAPAAKQATTTPAAAVATGGAGGSATSGAGTSRRKRRAGALSAAGGTNGGSVVVPGASGSVSEGQGTPTGGRSPRTGGTSAGTPHGRWTVERYDSARRSLVHVLRALHATAPEFAVLRPALRAEARQLVGDTGLLDHLLKHLADTIVSEGGERLRRRHNRHGQMVYWLQSPEEAAREEAAVAEEIGALSEELREVREARTALAAVRSEAAAAIQAVSELKEKPEEAAASLGAVTPVAAAAAASLGAVAPVAEAAAVPAVELAARVEAVEGAGVDLARRLHDAEALAAAGLENVRQEMAAAGRVLGRRAERLSVSLEELRSRCAALETSTTGASEEAMGRFEATSAALQAAVSAVAVLQTELAQKDAAIAALRAEMTALGHTVAQMQMIQASRAFLPPPWVGQVLPTAGQQQQQQQQPMTPSVTAGTGEMSLNLAMEGPLVIPGQALEASTQADAAVAEAEAAAGRNTLAGDPTRVAGIDNTWPQGAGRQGVGG